MKYDTRISLYEVVEQLTVSSKPAVTVIHRDILGSHSSVLNVLMF